MTASTRKGQGGGAIFGLRPSTNHIPQSIVDQIQARIYPKPEPAVVAAMPIARLGDVSGASAIPTLAQSFAEESPGWPSSDIPQTQHHYPRLNSIIPCPATNAQIGDIARRFQAPGQPDRPIVDGEEFPASVLGVKGSVRAYTYDNGDHDGSVITTLNKTQERPSVS